MKPTISYQDFLKLDLRVGMIIKCEKKENADKLLRLIVDFGELGEKNILSGISEWYKPEELINKQFVFIVNLEPRQIMGEESEGMILAAEGERPEPLLIGNQVPNGTLIK